MLSDIELDVKEINKCLCVNQGVNIELIKKH